MAQHEEHAEFVKHFWQTYLTQGKVPPKTNHEWYESRIFRPFIRALPSDPRCRICYYPFHGIGGMLARTFFGLVPSKMNPQLCNVCERFADRHQGGAEIELSLLFADVRGSTRIAEGMNPSEFSALIDRFYRAATRILFRRNAFVEKLIGDEVTGFFVPGFAGQEHARVAIEAGREILAATGHGSGREPWIPVGVGVHTGIAYVGAITTGAGSSDIAVLGDNVNAAARIASQAGVGELLASEEAIAASGLDFGSEESRHLELKGRTEPVDIRVIRPGGSSH
jgi:adenylate cyclase